MKTSEKKCRDDMVKWLKDNGLYKALKSDLHWFVKDQNDALLKERDDLQAQNAELLEALKYVAENHHEGSVKIEFIVLDAIAKAEGHLAMPNR